MNINTVNPAPVFAYSAEGKKHLAPVDVIEVLEAELYDAELRLDGLNEDVKDGDYELQSDRDTQEGFVLAYRHVLRYLKREISEAQFRG